MGMLRSGFLISLFLANNSCSFQLNTKPNSFVTARERTNSRIFSTVIQADEIDFEFDEGAGGVRLARESAIKIVGKVKHAPGTAEAKVSDLMRYNQVVDISENSVKDILKKQNGNVLCTGIGKELYKDPGETAESVILLAPHQAVKDALKMAGSAIGAEKVVINFLGGDDLQVLQVLDAVQEIVLDLDVKTNSKIFFHSLCHSSFPNESATLTVVTLPEESLSSGFQGKEKSVSNGEVYFCEGKYFTVAEEDINTAVA